MESAVPARELTSIQELIAELQESVQISKLRVKDDQKQVAVEQARWVTEKLQFLEKQHASKIQNVRLMYTKLEDEVQVGEMIEIGFPCVYVAIRMQRARSSRNAHAERSLFIRKWVICLRDSMHSEF